jgi:hypothetical protein
MKSNKVWFIGLKVAFLIMCFTFGTAHSGDLSGWVDKWFKYTNTSKGYESWSDPNHAMGPESEKTTGYLKITGWNTTGQFLSCSVYEQDEEGNIDQIEIDLHYLGGTDLDFLCYYSDIVSEGEYTGFVLRIRGKESKGILKSAKFKTMGGFYWEKSQNFPDNGLAGGITITGSLIAESKLPSWVPK